MSHELGCDNCSSCCLVVVEKSRCCYDNARIDIIVLFAAVTFYVEVDDNILWKTYHRCR